MSRRSLICYGILLLCVFMGACNKRELDDEQVKQDENMINKTENDIGDFSMTAEGAENNSAITSGEKETITEQKNVDFAGDLFSKYTNLSAGTVINTEGLDREFLNSLFFIKEIDQDIIDRIYGKSYKEYSDIPYSELRYIRVLHTDFEGQTRIGELIVNKKIAQDVVDIFRDLYDISYPIEKMLLIDEYDADDIKSMEDNNTSAFNFRYIEGTKKRSVHSDGLAIDINPLYNPYVRTKDGKSGVLPENAAEYADRTKDNIYYIKKDDPCYKAFTSRGFTWGGEWKSKKDYQHFEKRPDD